MFHGDALWIRDKVLSIPIQHQESVHLVLVIHGFKCEALDLLQRLFVAIQKHVHDPATDRCVHPIHKFVIWCPVHPIQKVVSRSQGEELEPELVSQGLKVHRKQIW